MLKAKAIMWAIKAVMWCAAVGIGIWYLSSSIGGGAITYTSLPNFLSAIGACSDGVCDVAAANGCFLCPFIEKLFLTIGTAAEGFWNALVSNIWIIMAAGFGIWLFIFTFKHVMDAAKKNADLSTGEKKLDFKKEWFDKVWPQALRVMIAGVFLGAIGIGGHAALKTVSNITITPVMYLGTELAMAATGVGSAAECGSHTNDAAIADNAIGPALKPFMCIVGNLNTVVLAGAAGGFSLMNYSWMGLGGGMFTWIAGLALVIIFLYIGFRIFFQVLTVVFQLVFLIIFLPLVIAAWAFESTWDMAKNVVSNSINMLCNCAIRVVSIALQVLIMYATISYAADEFFPGPVDGYTAILPPGIAMGVDADTIAGGNDATASVAHVFAKCERVATVSGTKELDRDAFRDCFVSERTAVEARHPGAFDFMSDGLAFLLMMIGLWLAYQYVIVPALKKIFSGADLNLPDEEKVSTGFDYGRAVRELGESLWNIPKKIGDSITKGMKK